MRPDTKIYFPGIDALRFIAFALIFIAHVFTSNDPEILRSGIFSKVSAGAGAGLVALEFFFVLSGFLITWILFTEQAAKGQFSFSKYFIRRSLRIWPLYFLTVAIGYLLVLFSSGSHPLPPLPHFIFFTLNFYVADHGTGFLFFLVFLWTIAVEEQFYLFWGLFLRFFKKYFSEMCVSLILLSVFFRLFNYRDEFQMFSNTFNVCGDFAIGALMAKMAFNRTKVFEKLSDLSKGVIAFFYIFLLMNLVFYRTIYLNFYTVVPERLVFSLLFGFMIFEQNFCKHSIFKLGKFRVLNYLGKISFGLYIYHGIVITFFSKLAGRFHWDGNLFSVLLLNPVLILTLTILISVISYEFMEKRIMRLKERFY